MIYTLIYSNTIGGKCFDFQQFYAQLIYDHNNQQVVQVI